jgi:hypothetical protein
LQGQPGPQGPAGTAVAYAHVFANGTLDAANSKNITAAMVSKPQFTANFYCFHNLGFTPHNVIVNVDDGNPGGNAVVGQVTLGDGNCHTYLPSFFSQVEIFETDGNSTGASSPDKAFFILFN